MTDIQTIKEFFTDGEWDAIYDALSEHRECVDDENVDNVDNAYFKIATLFETK